MDPQSVEPMIQEMLPRPWRVTRRRAETPDTFTLDLEPVDGDGISFAPGQFTMMYAPGVGEIPISISGDPASGPLVQTIRDVGPVSHAVASARAGTVLGLRGAYGRPWPVDEARGHDVVVVAGGLGLAPVRPILYHVLRNRAAYGEVVLLVGARTPDDLLYKQQLKSWVGRRDLRALVSVDRADPRWTGHVGVVSRLLPKARFSGPDTHAFLCGPEIMMTVMADALGRLGVPAAQTWVSLERNMRCGIGVCGHCQLGPRLLCKDGPVVSMAEMGTWMKVREA